jgi:hypothetical protein
MKWDLLGGRARAASTRRSRCPFVGRRSLPEAERMPTGRRVEPDVEVVARAFAWIRRDLEAEVGRIAGDVPNRRAATRRRLRARSAEPLAAACWRLRAAGARPAASTGAGRPVQRGSDSSTNRCSDDSARLADRDTARLYGIDQVRSGCRSAPHLLAGCRRTGRRPRSSGQVALDEAVGRGTSPDRGRRAAGQPAAPPSRPAACSLRQMLCRRAARFVA